MEQGVGLKKPPAHFLILTWMEEKWEINHMVIQVNSIAIKVLQLDMAAMTMVVEYVKELNANIHIFCQIVQYKSNLNLNYPSLREK
jgi:hypothetical protein